MNCCCLIINIEFGPIREPLALRTLDAEVTTEGPTATTRPVFVKSPIVRTPSENPPVVDPIPDGSFQLFLQPNLDDNGSCFYEFIVEGIPVLIYIDSSNWIFSADNINLYSLPISETNNECPQSELSDWTPFLGAENPLPPITSMFLSQVACEDEPQDVDIPIPVTPASNCNEPFSCKFVNLLKKQKRALAVDIAANRNYEVFGLKECDKNWNNLFMRYLIIDALECVPQGVYSEATENCLINKLTENCNC